MGRIRVYNCIGLVLGLIYAVQRVSAVSGPSSRTASKETSWSCGCDSLQSTVQSTGEHAGGNPSSLGRSQDGFYFIPDLSGDGVTLAGGEIMSPQHSGSCQYPTSSERRAEASLALAHASVGAAAAAAAHAAAAAAAAEAAGGPRGPPTVPVCNEEEQKAGLEVPRCEESEYQQRRGAFLAQAGPSYLVEVEALAHHELKRLNGQVYLDYTGSGLYQESQLVEAFSDLSSHLFGNAHSRSPSARLTDERIREARDEVLSFVGAVESEYAVIFTSGATGAMKLVGESFPFSKFSKFYYLRINHNSVLGIREFAYAVGATVRALSSEQLEGLLDERENRFNATQNVVPPVDLEKLPTCLFAYPAKDNFNGSEFPRDWIRRIHSVGLSDDCRWLVLLDAAAAAPLIPLRLSFQKGAFNEMTDNKLSEAASTYDASPDFVPISFYKIFGYPTGLGALVVKRSAANLLEKRYWGGGSVSSALCDCRWRKPKFELSARMEDGTVNFLSIAAIKFGFRKLNAIGLEAIRRHVASLTRHLFLSLKDIKHSNRAPLVLLYWNKKEDPSGGVVAFNILKANGEFVPFHEVEAAAAAEGIHLRTGCFCNPGACQDFLGLSSTEIVEASRARDSCSDPQQIKAGIQHSSFEAVFGGAHIAAQHQLSSKAIGAVRVSLGYLSTFRDVDRLIQFLDRFKQ